MGEGMGQDEGMRDRQTRKEAWGEKGEKRLPFVGHAPGWARPKHVPYAVPVILTTAPLCYR